MSKREVNKKIIKFIMEEEAAVRLEPEEAEVDTEAALMEVIMLLPKDMNEIFDNCIQGYFSISHRIILSFEYFHSCPIK